MAAAPDPPVRRLPRISLGKHLLATGGMNNGGARSPIKEFSASYGHGCFTNGEQDGRQIKDAIHGDQDGSMTITEVTDGEQDLLCEALADGDDEEDSTSTEATEDDVSAGEVSHDQEWCTQDISTCYPCDCVANLRLLASSSHRVMVPYTRAAVIGKSIFVSPTVARLPWKKNPTTMDLRTLKHCIDHAVTCGKCSQVG